MDGRLGVEECLGGEDDRRISAVKILWAGKRGGRERERDLRKEVSGRVGGNCWSFCGDLGGGEGGLGEKRADGGGEILGWARGLSVEHSLCVVAAKLVWVFPVGGL